MYDFRNPAAQTEELGRVYEATIRVEFYMPVGVAADEDTLVEWLAWELNLSGTGPHESEPLSEISIDVADYSVEDLRDLKVRRFTEWSAADADGRRSGRRKTVPV